jgi:hypothetical protein
VGERGVGLDDNDGLCTWLSSDGGATWQDVGEGAYIYEYAGERRGARRRLLPPPRWLAEGQAALAPTPAHVPPPPPKLPMN